MKTALVTGGNGDLAREVSRQLREHGYTVLAPCRGEMDVTENDDVRCYLDKVEGPIDVLVNNAGIASWNTGTLAASVQFDVNTLGAMRVTDAALPKLSDGARVVMVTSDVYHAPSLPMAAAGYAMSKAALDVLAKAYATTYPHLKVRRVCPGHVRTKMNPGAETSVEDGARRIVEACL